MRNPDRIQIILDALGEAWRKNPDLRLAQLLTTCGDHAGIHRPNPLFYVEDDLMLEAIKSLIVACEARDKE